MQLITPRLQYLWTWKLSLWPSLSPSRSTNPARTVFKSSASMFAQETFFLFLCTVSNKSTAICPEKLLSCYFAHSELLGCKTHDDLMTTLTRCSLFVLPVESLPNQEVSLFLRRNGVRLMVLCLLWSQCNNPMTKEPKLQAAVRIVAEWSDYDQEIKRLQTRVHERVNHSAKQQDTAGT